MKIQDLLTTSESQIKGTINIEPNEWNHDLIKEIDFEGSIYSVCFDIKHNYSESTNLEETVSDYDININYIESTDENGESELIYHCNSVLNNIFEILNPNN